MSKVSPQVDENLSVQRFRETAPSQLRVDESRVPRILGFIGLILVSIAAGVVLVPSSMFANYIGPFWRTTLMALGISGLLLHAVRDGDVQVRRMFGLLGFALLGCAALISALPIGGPAGTQFLPWGLVFLCVGLLFLMAFLRFEDDPIWRTTTLRVMAVVGAGLALAGLVGAHVSERFFIPHGLLLALVGLAYLWAFVSLEGASSNFGYYVAFGFGVAGAVTFLVGLGRSVVPQLAYNWGWLDARPEPFFIPSGFLLMVVGLIYTGLSIGICSDRRFVVMTRRELAAYFCSPLAYFVMLAFSLFAWILFMLFVGTVEEAGRRQAIPEPVIAIYLVQWFPIIFLVILGIPVLTMRSFSEEHRTGTMEVLLTAPVGEVGVVLSKFVAVFLFYMVLWTPWILCLVAFRVGTGTPFEYRPLLSFFLSVACFGAGFLAMGLFFSSLTRNQLIAAVLCAATLLLFTISFWVKDTVQRASPGSPWVTALEHVSFIELIILSGGEGAIAPKFLLFHISAAIFWLFLTVKVLESRKWS